MLSTTLGYSFVLSTIALLSNYSAQIYALENVGIPRLLIFSVWARYDPKINKRIKHHKAYADRHGYSYRLYMNSGLDEFSASPDSGGVEVSKVDIPSEANAYEYRAGWYKVFALMKLLQEDIYEYFFYLDLDAVFYNFNWPIMDVIKPFSAQSVLLQRSDPATKDVMNINMQTNAHIIIMKNSDASRLFVKNWFEMIEFCPEINMEQGALYATVAELYSNYTIPLPCKTTICPKSRRHILRKNGAFGDCFAAFMRENFGQNPVHPDVHVFKFWNDSPAPPQDGFGANVHFLNLKSACPLTLHPFKKFEEEFTPVYDKCSSNRGSRQNTQSV